MNAWAVIEKGLTVLPSLIEAGVSVAGTISKMLAVAEQAKQGKVVPQSELEALEAELDAMLEEFNAPLPPEDAA